MKKVLKSLLFALGIAVLLSALAAAGTIGFEKYEKVTWVPTELKGVRLGTSRKDFLFNTKYAECSEDEVPLSSCDLVYVKTGPKKKDDEWVATTLIATFRGDVISKILTYDNRVLQREVPFANVEELIRHKGTPDILQVDSDFENRRYTYVEEDITVTLTFRKNSLTRVYVGDVEIADTSIGDLVAIMDDEWIWKFSTSEYTVNGQNLCPSSEAPTCPFDKAHEIKAEFKELKPRDLL